MNTDFAVKEDCIGSDSRWNRNSTIMTSLMRLLTMLVVSTIAPLVFSHYRDSTEWIWKYFGGVGNISHSHYHYSTRTCFSVGKFL